MTRSLLGEELRGGESGDRGTYQSGKAIDAALIEGILETLENRVSKDSRRESYMRSLLMLMPRPEDDDFNPDGLLDALVLRLTLGEMDAYYLVGANELMDDVVQTLYTKGYNNFHIDLTSLINRIPKDWEWLPSLGRRLRGSERRPLKCSYRSDANGLGYDSGDCVLRLEGEAPGVGWKAQNSTFYVPTLGIEGMFWPTYVTIEIDDWPTNCSYYLENGITELESDTRDTQCSKGHLYKTLALRGNRFLVPNGKGGWKEVTP